MRFTWKKLQLGLAFLLAASVAQASECTSLKTSQDAIALAFEANPKIQRAGKKLDQASERVGYAGQLSNPDFESRGTMGRNLGDQIMQLEISLTQPIDIGGKRSSRVGVAQAETRKGEAELRGAKEEVFIETALALYRLRQNQLEQEILNEALSTFRTITDQFRSRPRLSPEQQVSLGIIQIAQGDYGFRKSSLESEEFETRRNLELGLGCRLPAEYSKIKDILPGSRATWPDVPVNTLTDFKDSTALAIAAEKDRAGSEYDLAKAESWPDLRIGPIFQYQAAGGIAYQTYGVGLSFQLPVLSQNGGGRAYALKGLMRAENDVALVRSEKSATFEILKQKYSRSARSLSESLSVKEIEGKHRNIERLFAQGLVGGATVVEAHRQIVDFTKNKHELENMAMESLLKIRALEGSLFEEKI